MATKRKAERCREFHEEWTMDYLFVEKNGKAICLVCNDTVSSLKKYNVKRHYQTHTNFIREHPLGSELRNSWITKACEELDYRRNMFSSGNKRIKDQTSASFELALLIAKKKRPMVEGEEIIKPALHIETKYLGDKASTFATGIPLSDNTMTRRMEMMSEDVSEQLIQFQADAVFFSIALDESTDATGTARLAIFGRVVDQKLNVKEELLGLVAMEGRTRGVDIFNVFKKCAEKMNWQWDKLTSVCTDGAPAMMGCNVGFCAKLEQFLGRTLLKYHCIIHQESLCGKSLQMKNVMAVVVKCVNDIRAAALKRREFRQLLNEVDEQYGELLHTEVRWLSRGKVLARFLDVKEHMCNFLCEKKMLPEERQKLKDRSWLNDLAFLTDISGQLNMLNKRMQGKQQLVSHLNDQVNSFRQKLQLFRHQLSERCFDSFLALKERVAEPGNKLDEAFYVHKLDVMIEYFEQRFKELDSDKAKHENLLFINPFAVDPGKMDFGFQELIDLQNSAALKARYKKLSVMATGQDLMDFWKAVPVTAFPELRSFIAKFISRFRTTYRCEQAFSVMKFVKSKYRTRLTHAHLEASIKLAVTDLQPRIEDLVKKVQPQGSH